MREQSLKQSLVMRSLPEGIGFNQLGTGEGIFPGETESSFKRTLGEALSGKECAVRGDSRIKVQALLFGERAGQMILRTALCEKRQIKARAVKMNERRKGGGKGEETAQQGLLFAQRIGEPLVQDRIARARKGECADQINLRRGRREAGGLDVKEKEGGGSRPGGQRRKNLCIVVARYLCFEGIHTHSPLSF